MTTGLQRTITAVDVTVLFVALRFQVKLLGSEKWIKSGSLDSIVNKEGREYSLVLCM